MPQDPDWGPFPTLPAIKKHLSGGSLHHTKQRFAPAEPEPVLHQGNLAGASGHGAHGAKGVDLSTDSRLWVVRSIRESPIPPDQGQPAFLPVPNQNRVMFPPSGCHRNHQPEKNAKPVQAVPILSRHNKLAQSGPSGLLLHPNRGRCPENGPPRRPVHLTIKDQTCRPGTLLGAGDALTSPHPGIPVCRIRPGSTTVPLTSPPCHARASFADEPSASMYHWNELTTLMDPCGLFAHFVVE